MKIRHEYRCTPQEVAHIKALEVEGVEVYAIGDGTFKMYQKPSFLSINISGFVRNGEIYTIKEVPKVEEVKEVAEEVIDQQPKPKKGKKTKE